jgi:hypothetical protein
MLDKLKKINLNFPIVILVLIVAAYFRFTYLGYSDLQGDEAKPFEYRQTADFIGFLFSNSKGPGQYLIIKFTELLQVHNIDDEFLYRLPFAFAGFLSVFLFYFIAKKFFDSKTALYVLIISALNGFFIAFSRIIQYQSFKIFFALISTLFFLYFLKNKKKSNLLFSGIFIAVAFLFHYDALTLVIAQIIILFTQQDKVKNYLNYFLGLSLSLVFYIPYVFSEKFPSTLSYILNDRAVTNFSYDSVFYSAKLSSIYNSREYLLIIGLLAFFSLWNLSTVKIIRYRAALIGLVVLISARYFVEHPYKPLMGLSVGLALYLLYLIFSNKEIRTFKKYFYIWFIFSFTTYILVIGKPLTHIYNVFIPLTFVAAFQLHQIKNKFLKYGTLAILIISTVSFNYQAFIEHDVEYPWQPEKYIFGSMYEEASEGEVVRGIFGFPYYRALGNLDKDLNSVVDKNSTPNFNTNIKIPRLVFYQRTQYPKDLPMKAYYIYVKDNRNPDPNTLDLSTVQKTNLFENQYYIIYSLP